VQVYLLKVSSGSVAVITDISFSDSGAEYGVEIFAYPENFNHSVFHHPNLT
jgi:hypothetical protein